MNLPRSREECQSIDTHTHTHAAHNTHQHVRPVPAHTHTRHDVSLISSSVVQYPGGCPRSSSAPCGVDLSSVSDTEGFL